MSADLLGAKMTSGAKLTYEDFLLFPDDGKRHELIDGVPDLVIEVASPGTRRRDSTLKRRLYDRSGAAEYWIVDPEREAVSVYRRHGDGFGNPEEFTRAGGHILTTPLLPGLDLPLARVFRP